MATTATAGRWPINWSSSRPQISSWIERGSASRRRINAAGAAVPLRVCQIRRELSNPSPSPSSRLSAQPSSAMPAVIPSPRSSDCSTSGSVAGVSAAQANWPIRSQPPPCSSCGSISSTGTSTRAGSSTSRGGAGLMPPARRCRHRAPAAARAGWPEGGGRTAAGRRAGRWLD